MFHSLIEFVSGDVFVYNHSPKVKKDPEKYPVRKKKDLNTKEISLCTAQHIFSISGEAMEL